MTQPLHTRRSVLGALAAASLTLGCGRRSEEQTVEVPTPEPAQGTAAEAAQRGVTWLLGAQGEDGRWRSETYGFMSRGESLTPFVLKALLTAPDLTRLTDAVGRGLNACLQMANDDGALGFGGPAPDYPVYATALALSCLGRVRPAGWLKVATPLRQWLVTQQFGSAWRGHTALGGFGMGWQKRPVPPNAGHVDLSMTRRALEALRDTGSDVGDPAFRLGNRFLAACQAQDGGYLYSPVETALNKGLVADDVQASYGTATADGLLASFAVWGPGWADLSPRPTTISRALTRLHAIHRVDENPGVRGGPMEPFAMAMRGYYRAAAAEVFRLAGGPEGWREQLIEAVLAEQKDNGRWESESPLQKENDPLIATAFAVSALHHALS